MRDSAKAYLAFDLGAESGRAVLGRLKTGVINADEVHRFRNQPKLADYYAQRTLTKRAILPEPLCARDCLAIRGAQRKNHRAHHSRRWWFTGGFLALVRI